MPENGPECNDPDRRHDGMITAKAGVACGFQVHRSQLSGEKAAARVDKQAQGKRATRETSRHGKPNDWGSASTQDRPHATKTRTGARAGQLWRQNSHQSVSRHSIQVLGFWGFGCAAHRKGEGWGAAQARRGTAHGGTRPGRRSVALRDELWRGRARDAGRVLPWGGGLGGLFGQGRAARPRTDRPPPPS